MTTPGSTRTLGQLAALIGGTLIAGSADQPVEELGGLEDAEARDLSFFDGNAKFKKAAMATRAGALLVREKVDFFKGAQVQTPMPYIAFQQLVREVYPEPVVPGGTHPSAVLAPGAAVDPTASIGCGVSLGPNSRVGARTVIYPGTYIGRDVVIGEDCVLHANVTLYARTRLGNRVIVHSGAVIGSDGFGYRRDENGHQKIRHVGLVEVHDDAEIGANCAIDRGTFGRTVIGKGSKLDNLVHVAHNVRIGEHALVIAQVGLAGGVRIGSNAIIAGQAGIADHAVVGDAAIVMPQTAVPKRVKPGAVVGGTPMLPAPIYIKAMAALRFLPALLDRMRVVEKKLGITAAAATTKTEDGDGSSP